MDKILSYIISDLGDGFSRIRLNSCQLDVKSKKLDFKFILPKEDYDKLCTEGNKEKLHDTLKRCCGDFDIKFDINSVYSDAHVVRNAIFNYMSEHFPIAAESISANNFVIKGESPSYDVVIKLASHIFTYLRSANFESLLTDFLEGEYCDDFIIELFEDKSLNTQSEIIFSPQKENLFNSKTVSIEISRVLIGDEIRVSPKQIKVLKGDTSAVVCGKISAFSEKTAKNSGKLYYKLVLTDPTGEVDCLFFPKGNNQRLLSTLVKDDDEIVVYGDVKDSDFGRTVFIKDISRCRIDWDSVDEYASLKEAPDYYTLVEPKPYAYCEQDNLFEKEECKYLKDKTFVIFDFETTGLDTNTCKVIELGAIKIKNGEWVEEFCTFANPGMKISQEITDLTSITQEMLDKEPSFSEILPDFLHFCKDAILVVHNQEYDIKILSRYCREEGYRFDNKVHCTLALSNKFLPHLRSHKLVKVGEYFGYQNKHAHRAVGDVEVTAKIFCKFAEKL